MYVQDSTQLQYTNSIIIIEKQNVPCHKHRRNTYTIKHIIRACMRTKKNTLKHTDVRCSERVHVTGTVHVELQKNGWGIIIRQTKIPPTYYAYYIAYLTKCSPCRCHHALFIICFPRVLYVTQHRLRFTRTENLEQRPALTCLVHQTCVAMRALIQYCFISASAWDGRRVQFSTLKLHFHSSDFWVITQNGQFCIMQSQILFII